MDQVRTFCEQVGIGQTTVTSSQGRTGFKKILHKMPVALRLNLCIGLNHG